MQIRILLPFRRALRRLLVMCACAFLLLQGAAPSSAEPAMWVVKDEDSTLYLFGTFHLMKPETEWWSDKVDAAFNESGEVWLEMTEEGDAASLQGLVFKHGIDSARPLSSKLKPEDWERVKAATKRAGLPAGALGAMRPWLAAVTLAVAPMLRDGYDIAKGADKQLERSARMSNKAVRRFETPEQQLLFFASLSEQSEVAFLLQTLDEMAEGTGYVDRLSSAWSTGDTTALEAMFLTKMKTHAPELYETLIVRRNMAWCDQIDAIMQGAGTSFIAVGAGHLIGEHSVPAILAERGFTVTPY